MQCPACGSVHPETSAKCACGYDFFPVEQKNTGPPDLVGQIPLAGILFQSDKALEAPASYETRGPSFHGDGKSLFKIHLLNLLLTILTLGGYYFWAKVKVRNYLYAQTKFEGDRFAFHGTGMELLIGFLKIVLFLGLYVGAVAAIPMVFGDGLAPLIGRILSYFVLLVVIPIAIVGSKRYRLGRTSWRGIRFSFRGRAKDLIGILVRDGIFIVQVFGLYYPFMLHNIRNFVVGHSYFGNRRFNYDGKAWDLFGHYVLAFLLFLPTFGLYWFWFVAWKQRYYWKHTTLEKARFQATMTGGRLLGLTVTKCCAPNCIHGACLALGAGPEDAFLDGPHPSGRTARLGGHSAGSTSGGRDGRSYDGFLRHGLFGLGLRLLILRTCNDGNAFQDRMARLLLRWTDTYSILFSASTLLYNASVPA